MSTAVRWQNRQNPQGDSNWFSVDFGKGRARKLRARPLEESWSPVGLVDLDQLHGGVHPILHIPAAAADVADHRDLAQQGVPGGVNVAAASVAAGVGRGFGTMSMLPYTALAYDERSRWDQMAAMMPYSARDVVLSKYLFGWIAVAVSAAATFVLQTILSVIWLSDVEGPSIPVILLSVCVAVCILDITLP